MDRIIAMQFEIEETNDMLAVMTEDGFDNGETLNYENSNNSKTKSKRKRKKKNAPLTEEDMGFLVVDFNEEELTKILKYNQIKIEQLLDEQGKFDPAKIKQYQAKLKNNKNLGNNTTNGNTHTTLETPQEREQLTSTN